MLRAGSTRRRHVRDGQNDGMNDAPRGPADDPSERIVQQRIRNRVIEYLELASSYEDQQRYEREVPIAHVPYEVINQWGDNFPQGPDAEFRRSDVFSRDEITAITRFHEVLEAVTSAVPDDFPTLEAVQAMPAWDRLRGAAAATHFVLMRRGKMPEDREA